MGMAETSIPCSESTLERLRELRGEDSKSWDVFLNIMADVCEKRNDENDAPEIDTQALVDDLVTQLPPRIAEEMEGRMR
jgi:hypothetical protein